MSRKGTKKMKKNYLGFGLVYCVLALVIFSVLMSFYTKKKIDVINNGMSSIVLLPETLMGGIKSGTPETLAHNAVNSWKFLSNVGDDVGFYSSVVDTENNGRVLFESQDFLQIWYYVARLKLRSLRILMRDMKRRRLSWLPAIPDLCFLKSR